MVKKRPIEKKQSEIQSLNLIEHYRKEIEIKLNEIREFRELIKEINKSI